MRRPKRPWPWKVFLNSSSGTLPDCLRRRPAQKDAQAASCRQSGNVITRGTLGVTQMPDEKDARIKRIYFVTCDCFTKEIKMATDNPMKDQKLFGDADARNAAEIEGLKYYFLELPYFEQILRGEYCIITGRKGTGKSAIKTKLLQYQDRRINCEIEPLLPNHKLFELYSNSSGKKGGSFSSYERAWVSYIISTLFLRLRDEGIAWGRNGDFIEDVLKRLQISDNQKLIQRLRELTVGIEKIAQVGVTLDPATVSQILPNEAEIPTLLSILRAISEKVRKPIIGLIDRVDQGLEDPFQAHELDNYIKYIGGLLLATAWINSKIGNDSLIIYSFVRRDLIDQVAIRLHSTTEFESLICNLEWKLEPLMDIIGLRISTYFGDSKYDPTDFFRNKEKMFFSRNVFYRVFGCKYLDELRSWAYCLFHTHMRPRDIIVLLNSFRRAAEQAEKRIIDGSAVNNGMYAYSQRKYQDVISSNKYRVTGLNHLIDSFRTSTMVFALDELKTKIDSVAEKYGVQDLSSGHITHLSECEKLIIFLYDVGFIVGSSRTEHLPFVSHYLSPYYNILEGTKLGIHPAFHRELMSGKGSKIATNVFLNSLNARANQ
jgi:hypothetical protein